MTRPGPLGVPLAQVPRGFPGRVEFIKSAARLADAPHLPQPEVCFCGRSNVGKSSLLNTLCNRRRLARVSSTPGRTRLINFFNVQDVVTFVDLPGYGWAKAPRAFRAGWAREIPAFLESRPQLLLALLLVDIRRDPGEEEAMLAEWFAGHAVIVATKADKLSASRRGRRLDAIGRGLGVPRRDVLAFSAPERLGRDVLWGAILAQVKAHREAGP